MKRAFDRDRVHVCCIYLVYRYIWYGGSTPPKKEEEVTIVYCTVGAMVVIPIELRVTHCRGRFVLLWYGMVVPT
jgi:hypothetical protein